MSFAADTLLTILRHANQHQFALLWWDLQQHHHQIALSPLSTLCLRNLTAKQDWLITTTVDNKLTLLLLDILVAIGTI